MISRYIMVGGFLGAGKTTALVGAGRRLTARGLRVGLIMNDQSGGLVDTAVARSSSLPVEEITGGCFCCRFNSLVEAVERLDAATRPDVFLAEPVGSCTDLQATVVFPLQQLYGSRYAVAPLTVLMDPERALRILDTESGAAFSPKVQYVYLKQLEEAELLAINKVDAHEPTRIARLRRALEARYPRARVLELSARLGTGLDEWLATVTQAPAAGQALDIDYDAYAEGEAMLGWLNCTSSISGGEFDADTFLLALAAEIRIRLARAEIEIAHLKMTLTPAEGHGIAVVNLTRTDADPVLAFAMDGTMDAGELTINLRAEGAPDELAEVVRNVLSEETGRRGLTAALTHLERFRPARPVPTHRLAALSQVPQ